MPLTAYRPTAAVHPGAGQIAQWLGGQLRQGELAPRELTGLSTLAMATETEITFVASEKFLGDARMSQAGLVITPREMDLPGRASVAVDEVWAAVATLMNRLYPAPKPLAEIHPTAILGRDVRLGEGVSIGPYCVIGDGCEIGDGAVLGPHCIIEGGCRIGRQTRLAARVTLACPVTLGERVLLHPGVVLGSDGFKFEMVRGRPHKIPQAGTVVVEDEVEIGANTAIDRAFLFETRIGRGTKIDNLVQIAHNVQVGPSCIMAAQVGIAGSTRIGAGCLMGGQVGIRDGIKIGDGVILGAQSGLHADILESGIYMGSPAVPIKDFWRVAAVQAKLPELLKRLRIVEQKLEAASPGGGPSTEG